MTCLIQAQKPESRRIDRLPDRQQAVVLQDDGLAIAQVRRDALPFLAVEDDAAELRIHRVALVEAERVLRHHVKLAAEDGEGFAVDAVRVAGGVDVWAGFVDFAVDGESGLS